MSCTIGEFAPGTRTMKRERSLPVVFDFDCVVFLLVDQYADKLQHE